MIATFGSKKDMETLKYSDRPNGNLRLGSAPLLDFARRRATIAPDHRDGRDLAGNGILQAKEPRPEAS